MLFSALILGLSGSFHCVGMCGAISLALPKTQGSLTAFIWSRLLYNLGRAITYTIMGLIIGSFAEGIAWAGYQRTLSIVAGSMMILLAIFQVQSEQKIAAFFPLKPLWKKLKAALGANLQTQGKPDYLLIGALNGFLPCGFVYVALAGALSMGDWLQSGLYMLLFGLGTIPLMLTSALAAGWLRNLLGAGKLRYIVGLFSFVIGVLLVVRGWNAPVSSSTKEIQHCTHQSITPEPMSSSSLYQTAN